MSPLSKEVEEPETSFNVDPKTRLSTLPHHFTGKNSVSPYLTSSHCEPWQS